MKKCLLMAVLVCSGCAGGLFPYKKGVAVDRDKSEVAVELPSDQERSDILQPSRTIDELLVQRLRICNEAEARRAAVIASLKVQVSAANGVDEDLLNQMLAASCSPAKTPGVLNQILADLTSAGTWPEQYAAFFDLMISGQRAYAAVEKVYLDLKSEHEKTIQGLSEIESQIENHSQAPVP